MRAGTALFAAIAITCGCGAPRGAPGDPTTDPELVAEVVPDLHLPAVDPEHVHDRHVRAHITTDKPLYQPGETIRFRIDARRATDLAPRGDDSIDLQLLDARNQPIARAKAKLRAGVASGSFALDEDISGGGFEIRATGTGYAAGREITVARYQPPRLKKRLELARASYAPGDRVEATYSARRRTGEPLAGARLIAVLSDAGSELARAELESDAAGWATVAVPLPGRTPSGDVTLAVIAVDGELAESIERPVPITGAVQVELFPEGGALIDGLPARVFVAATDPSGKPAAIKGRVVDGQGRQVASLHHHRDGRSSFEITARRRRPLSLAIDGRDSPMPLPAVRKSGCSMRRRADRADRVRLAMTCTRTEVVRVQAFSRGARVAATKVQIPARRSRIVELPMAGGVQGVVKITAMTSGETTVAERVMYFGRGRDPRIELSADRTGYSPGDEVAIDISSFDRSGAPVGGSFAFAVVDDSVLARADDRSPHLIAAMYLGPELGAIEVRDLDGYLDEDAGDDLDALLATAYRPQLVRPCLAGDLTTGGLRGVVKLRPTGEALAGATVVATREGARANRVAITDVAGRFALGELEPGAYTLALYYASEVVIRGGVSVRADRCQAIDVEFPELAGGEAILISGRAPVIDPTSTTQGITLDYIQNMPVPGRTFEAALGAASGAQADMVGVSFSGSSSLENQYVEPGRAGARRVEPPVRARTDFRETVHWVPDLRIGDAGRAAVQFKLPDSATSFRVIAQGFSTSGRPARGELVIRSAPVFSIDARVPHQVTTGDRIELPVTITNRSDGPISGRLDARLARGVLAPEPGATRQAFRVAAGAQTTLRVPVMVRSPGIAAIDLGARAGRHRDRIRYRVEAVAAGYPAEIAVAGTLEPGKRTLAFDLPAALPGTAVGSLSLYPSVAASIVAGTESVLNEPSGCFEQTSASSYPNLLAVDLLRQSGRAEPALMSRASGLLARGYKRLVEYETDSGGFEWFGQAPGHEALTAYGLLQFEDMRRVYGGVSRDMIERTERWILGRRDGEGGYRRNRRAVDGFGHASEAVTDAYITWALAEAGRGGRLAVELDALRGRAAATRDPYIKALAANAWLVARPKSRMARELARQLAALQRSDGSFPGAAESITRSGGESLLVETTALAALALTAAGDRGRAFRAVKFLAGKRNARGGFASTQATVLALRAMATFSRGSSSAAGAVRIGDRRSIRLGGAVSRLDRLDARLVSGRNAIPIEYRGRGSLPYAFGVSYRSATPPTRSGPVEAKVNLGRTDLPLGEGTRLTVEITNRSDAGIPMVLARVGIPGGLEIADWQIDALRDRSDVAFVETRPRELSIYLHGMAPRARLKIPVSVTARVPGTYAGPPSSAYLYYTAEHKRWSRPLSVTIR
jgi:hypothetical protein